MFWTSWTLRASSANSALNDALFPKNYNNAQIMQHSK